MRLKAISSYLESLGLGEFGKTIFVTEMPLECQRGILLMNTYGGTPIDPELPGWRETGFRVVVRAPGYEDGELFAEQIVAALTIHSERQMGQPPRAIVMRVCMPMTEPKPYRRSDAGVWEFESDVECIYINR